MPHYATNTGFSATSGACSSVSIYADLLQVKTPHVGKVGGGVRGKCQGFSQDSRRRLMYRLAQWSLAGLHTYFVTLTYPAIFSSDWHVWKRDLEAFVKVLKRSFPDALGMCWRVEFQKRGAPHFHLIVVCSKPLCVSAKRLVSRSWARIVRDGYLTAGDKKVYKEHFDRHVKAGTQVKDVNGRRQLKKYVSKYVAKSGANGAGVIEEWGRNWGFDNLNGELDFSPLAEVSLNFKQVAVVRRIVRRWLRSKGQGRFADTLGGMMSFSVLGCGAESENGNFAYKVTGGAHLGLFKPHKPPPSSNELTFIERVRLGYYPIRQGVVPGSVVTTPLGRGYVQSVLFVEALGRVRCSVLLDDWHEKKKWFVFDLWEVQLVKDTPVSQADLWEVGQ